MIHTRQDRLAAHAWKDCSVVNDAGKSVQRAENGQVVWRFNYDSELNKPYFHPVALPGGPTKVAAITWTGDAASRPARSTSSSTAHPWKASRAGKPGVDTLGCRSTGNHKASPFATIRKTSTIRRLGRRSARLG